MFDNYSYSIFSEMTYKNLGMTGHTCKPNLGELETGRSVCSLAPQPSLFSSRPPKNYALRVRSGTAG